MGSVKFKLVVYILLLALAPLGAAFWGFAVVVHRSETRRVDARLEAGLRAALTAYQDDVRAAGRKATAIPLDAATLRRLGRRAGLDEDDRLVLLDHGRIVTGPRRLVGTILRASVGSPGVTRVAGTRYRALATGRLPEPASAAFAVLAPQARIDRANAAATRRLGAALVAALALIALVAYFLSTSIVRALAELVRGAKAIARGRLDQRVPVRGRDEFAELAYAFNEMAEQLELRVAELEDECRRLRESTLRFGDVLAATHADDHLRRVIVETAVEATGAAGGELLGQTDRVVVGDTTSRADRLALPLLAGPSSFGTLVLHGDSFAPDTRELATLLARQGVVALEDARLHAIVERQASRDGLTGLSNRRHGDQMLREEVLRAKRFGGPLALVLADLDDFKAVNDRYGHPTGDLVLREFAATVLATVREIDHAARWGGEEFAIILPGADGEGGAQLAERVRRAFEKRAIPLPDGRYLNVTASFGVASFPDEHDEEHLVCAADEALYAAKRAGKNRVVAAAAPLLVRRTA